MTNVPLDRQLYDQIVQQAKTKFLVWPSAYASGWVVKTYLARGGTYRTDAPTQRPLKRWYNQNWIDVCHYLETGTKRPCGRKTASWQDYPYCRPEKKISPKTPRTLDQLLRSHGRKRLQEFCKTKKTTPVRRIMSTPSEKTFRSSV